MTSPKNLLTLWVSLLLAATGYAQVDCCNKIMSDGKALYQRGDYKAAAKQFTLAGMGCDNPCSGADEWLDKAITCQANPNASGCPTPQTAPQPVQQTTPSGGTYTETVNGVSFTMIAITGGSFSMGSNDGESDEKPVHTATVSSFYAGETEVTQALWRAVMGTTVPQQRDKADPSWPLRGEGDTYPMYYISWEEAQTFMQKLNTLTGKRYRLPTEAEWEYAAGGGSGSSTKWAGTGTESSFGSYAWYDGNANSSTHAVKAKSPNALGLYDMNGNVWEWCQDWYGTYPTSSSAGYSGPSTGSGRVGRGGGWNFAPVYCRVAIRGYDSPALRTTHLGFRLALSW